MLLLCAYTVASQLKVTPVKVFVVHLEVVTSDLNMHRISISPMYQEGVRVSSDCTTHSLVIHSLVIHSLVSFSPAVTFDFAHRAYKLEYGSTQHLQSDIYSRAPLSSQQYQHERETQLE